MNEEELVYQLKQESQDAFNRIYNMYSARLYAYCMQYVKLYFEPGSYLYASIDPKDICRQPQPEYRSEKE